MEGGSLPSAVIMRCVYMTSDQQIQRNYGFQHVKRVADYGSDGTSGRPSGELKEEVGFAIHTHYSAKITLTQRKIGHSYWLV